MNLKSPVFENDHMIPKKYTCEGIGINPPLNISWPPLSTKSFALFVHDPDAPTGDFLHWLLWNINPSVEEITEGSGPVGSIEGVNGTGEQGWVPPCPPSGMHHYEFRLYALNSMLDLPEMSTETDFLKAIEGHVLEETVLVGLYEKENA